MLRSSDKTDFDHAVVMVRDRLDELAPHFEKQGFILSDKSVHNLGSCNRLIALDSTYVELLGWPPGAPPARKEIADSAFGLEALVFRSYDAEATYARLKSEGFEVNPVQALTRPATVAGKEIQASFQTVRFAEQPLPGIRMYFCQHLTPECVWVPELMAHPNGTQRIESIEVLAAEEQAVAWRLGVIADAHVEESDDGWDVIHDPTALIPRLGKLYLANAEGVYPLDVGV
jgi:hypothetical protein